MANGDISLAAQEVADVIGRDNVDFQVWRGVFKFAQKLGQDIGRHHIRGCNPNFAFDGLRLARRGESEEVRGFSHLFGVIEQFHPSGGEF